MEKWQWILSYFMEAVQRWPVISLVMNKKGATPGRLGIASGKLFWVAAIAVLCFSFGSPGKKKVLIIGDSISLGYFPHVRDALQNEAEVTHNPGNAQHTGTGLQKIDQWLGDVHYDVIVFNWGLWDLCYRHPDAKTYGQRDKVNGKITHTTEQYEANMEKLVERLKRTGTKLIFVTTTVIPPGEAGRFEGDEVTYNKVAKAVMKKYKISVCDLYEPSIKIHKKYEEAKGDVHYTKEGYKALGNYIVDCIGVLLK